MNLAGAINAISTWEAVPFSSEYVASGHLRVYKTKNLIYIQFHDVKFTSDLASGTTIGSLPSGYKYLENNYILFPLWGFGYSQNPVASILLHSTGELSYYGSNPTAYHEGYYIGMMIPN